MKSCTRVFKILIYSMGYGAFRKARRKRAAAEIVLNQEATIAFARMFEMARHAGRSEAGTLRFLRE